MKDARDKLYPVVECLHIVAHFSSPPRSLESIIFQACSAVVPLIGPRAATIQVISDDSEGKIAQSKTRFRLGQSIPNIDRIDSSRSSVRIHLPARRARRFGEFGLYESLWSVEYDDYQVSHGIRLGPSVRMTLNLEWLSPEQEDALPQYTRELAGALAVAEEFRYGICDVADARETVLGLLYSGTVSNMPNLQRQLNRAVWEMEGERRIDKVRGVYWGNIFKAELIENIGGEDWLREYNKYKNHAEDEFCFPLASGAFLVLICTNIRELRPRSIAFSLDAVRRGAMLYRRLCAKKLMCGCDETDSV